MTIAIIALSILVAIQTVRIWIWKKLHGEAVRRLDLSKQENDRILCRWQQAETDLVVYRSTGRMPVRANDEWPDLIG